MLCISESRTSKLCVYIRLDSPVWRADFSAGPVALEKWDMYPENVLPSVNFLPLDEDQGFQLFRPSMVNTDFSTAFRPEKLSIEALLLRLFLSICGLRRSGSSPWTVFVDGSPIVTLGLPLGC